MPHWKCGKWIMKSALDEFHLAASLLGVNADSLVMLLWITGTPKQNAATCQMNGGLPSARLLSKSAETKRNIATVMSDNTLSIDREVMPIRHIMETEPDVKILNRIGVMEHSGVCFDRLLMRAAVAAEGDYRIKRKVCWEGNEDEPDLRQTEKLQGKRLFHFVPERSPCSILKVPQVKSACCGTWEWTFTSSMLMHRKWPREKKSMEEGKPFGSVI